MAGPTFPPRAVPDALTGSAFRKSANCAFVTSVRSMRNALIATRWAGMAARLTSGWYRGRPDRIDAGGHANHTCMLKRRGRRSLTVIRSRLREAWWWRVR